jgi:hypothetical protein
MKRQSENCNGKLWSCHYELQMSCRQTWNPSQCKELTGCCWDTTHACWLGENHCVLSDCYAAQQNGNFRVAKGTSFFFVIVQTAFFHMLYFSHSEVQKWRKLDRVILYNDLSTNVCTTAKIPHTNSSITEHKLLRWCQ